MEHLYATFIGIDNIDSAKQTVRGQLGFGATFRYLHDIDNVDSAKQTVGGILDKL